MARRIAAEQRQREEQRAAAKRLDVRCAVVADGKLDPCGAAVPPEERSQLHPACDACRPNRDAAWAETEARVRAGSAFLGPSEDEERAGRRRR